MFVVLVSLLFYLAVALMHSTWDSVRTSPFCHLLASFYRLNSSFICAQFLCFCFLLLFFSVVGFVSCSFWETLSLIEWICCSENTAHKHSLAIFIHSQEQVANCRVFIQIIFFSCLWSFVCATSKQFIYLVNKQTK